MYQAKHILHFVGTGDGPKVAIMGSIHGNEQIGKQLIDELAIELKNQKICGEIFLIFGNPRAYKANLRYLQHDMNRLFGLDFLNGSSNTLSYEQFRVLEICEVLKDADYLLDLHSTQKPSVPFVYCELDEAHLQLAKLFHTDYIVGTASCFKPKERTASADNYVDNHGGLGLTFEAGWNQDTTLFEKTFLKVKEYLNLLGVGFTESKAEFADPLVLEIYDHLVPKSDLFALAKDFKNFDFVAAGELIARDGSFSVSSIQDSYIVFPKADFSIGKAACYLASIKI